MSTNSKIIVVSNTSGNTITVGYVDPDGKRKQAILNHSDKRALELINHGTIDIKKS
ncbi:MAG: hypothetical protein AAF490_26085 [Chloroflexota bacterium]